MFLEFKIKNFGNHKESIVKLSGPVGLFIGANSAGKTNFLKALHFMSRIAARSRPTQNNSSPIEKTKIKPHEFNSYYYRWAKNNPMELSCRWQDTQGNNVFYKITFFPKDKSVLGTEEIQFIDMNKKEWVKQTRPSNNINLRLKIQEELTGARQLKIINAFFADLASIYFFHFQPSALKGLIKEKALLEKEGGILLPSAMGFAGENFPEIIEHIRDKEKKVYDKMVSFLQIIDEKFQSVRFEQHRLRWFYKPDKQNPKLYNFTTDQVSDGFIKAAAIALLVSLDRAPSLILLEEIENGINPLNIKYLLKWLYAASGRADSIRRGYITQFLLTSHSPIVLREFASQLEDVHVFRRIDKEFMCIVKNLKEVVQTFIEVGTITGELTEQGPELSKDKLESLWLEGLIG